MGKQKLTKAQIKQICKEYQAGKSQENLATIFNVCRRSIRRYLYKFNIPRRPAHGPKKLTENQAQELCCRYVAGERTFQLAADFNIHQSTAISYLKNHNIKPRSPCGGLKPGAEHPGWKGGRLKDGLGYIKIYKPKHPYPTTGPYVYEHRLIMEEILGRYLKPGEGVHHKNGIRDDNQIKNLALFISAQNYERHTCPKCGFRYATR